MSAGVVEAVEVVGMGSGSGGSMENLPSRGGSATYSCSLRYTERVEGG